MAIPQLSDEQVRSMTRQEKDRWWVANIHGPRATMAQLTLRSAATGFVLGGLLSATNLYVSAKAGVTLGVGLTSVILAFAMFKMLSAAKLAKDFTILENNAMQSIATAAGYMTVPLMSSMTAYFWKTNEVLPWHQVMAFNIVTAVMGVLVAFPMKRRFINDEQQPFPEGRACGVVLDTLYTEATAADGKKAAKAGDGMFQAKALLVAGLLTGFVQFMAGKGYMKLVWMRALGREWYLILNEKLGDAYYWFADTYGWRRPGIGGVGLDELSLWPSLDLAMIGTGGLMGMKTTTSMMIGTIINYAVLAPWMVNRGDIVRKVDEAGATLPLERADIFNQWAVWWGVGIMVVGSLVALFAKPKVIIDAFRGVFSGKQKAGDDPVAHIELPLKVSFLGLPPLIVLTAWMANMWFGVPWWMTFVAMPLVFILSLICTNAMALTSWTPTGALAKIPQFTFGMIDRHNPAVNLMTAGITASVASNAANLLSDIKPGYMLGAKPRQQAIGHTIGILAGAVVSTPLFYALFLSDREPGKPLETVMKQDGAYGMPSAIQWKGVADIIEKGFAGLSTSILWSLWLATGVAIVFEIVKIRTRGKFWLSPVSIGLGVVLAPDIIFAMFVGSALFALLHKTYLKRESGMGRRLWVDSLEPICAGIIAGAALTGIGDGLLRAFVVGK